MSGEKTIRDIVRVGSVISIDLSKNNKPMRAVCEVYSFRGDEFAIVGDPSLNGLPYEPKLDKLYPMKVSRDADGEYNFDGKFASQKMVGDKHFYLVKLQGSVRLEQRRNYYRFDVFNELWTKIFLKSGDKLIEMGRAIIKNISGGGLCLEFIGELDKEETYVFEFDFAGSSFKLDGKIVRYRNLTDSANKIDIGVDFFSISYTDRKKLMGQINVQQAKRLSKD